MSVRPQLKIQHSPVRSYANTQTNYVGAQTVIGQRGVLPTFTDGNSRFVSKGGSDSNAGTGAAPKLTIGSLFSTNLTKTTDYSGNARTLTETGIVPSLESYEYPAPAFGNYSVGPFSSTQYFSLPAALQTALSGKASLSVEAYVFLTALGANQIVLSAYDGATYPLRLWIDSTNKVNATINGTNCTSDQTLVSGRWYHLAYTYDGSNIKLYINNSLVKTQAKAGNTTTVTSARIGYDTTTASIQLRGYVNRIIFRSDVATSFPSTVSNTNVLARYDFQDAPAFSGYSYIVIADSGEYQETFTNHNFRQSLAAISIFSLDTQTPNITPRRGVIPNTYGAGNPGYNKPYTAAADVYYIAKAGNDGTGTKNNPLLPYLTIQAAITASGLSAGGVYEIQDSGVYTENLTQVAGTQIFIYSKVGQTPTLKPAKALLPHFTNATAGSQFWIYGCILNGWTSAQAHPAGIMGGTYQGLEIHDSTILGYSNLGDPYRTWAGAAFLYSTNCNFDTVYQKDNPNLIPYFYGSNCYYTCPKEIGTSFRAISRLTNWTFDSCNFFLDLMGGSLRYCRFFNVQGGINANPAGPNYSSASYRVYDTTFDTCTMTFNDPGTGGPDFQFVRCLSRNSRTHGFNFNGGSSAISKVIDCVSIGAAGDGFHANYSAWGWVQALVTYTTTTTQPGTIDIYGHAIPGVTSGNASKTTSFVAPGYVWATVSGGAGATAITFANCTSLGSSGYGFSGAAIIGSNLVSSHSGTGDFDGFAPATSVKGKPCFSATDASFQAGSPSTDAGDAPTFKDLGADAPVVRLKDGVINGLIIGPGTDEYSGALSEGGTFSFCTFFGGTGYAVKNSSGTVAYCAFANKGIGVIALNVGPAVTYSTFFKCSSAAVADFASLSILQNLTAFGCGTGLWSTSGAPNSKAVGNIWYSSGTYDLSTDAVLNYSLYEVSGRPVTEGTGVKRGNPLFMNTDTGDLRLQTVEQGYIFNSPAKQAGPTGQDLGAFAINYGTLVETWTTVDFATAGYRNPDEIVEVREPIKNFEGVREDGSTYTGAVAYRTLWRMEWTDKNDMPDAQVAALKAAFESSTGECKLDLGDGRGYVSCYLLKSEPFERRDLTGHWSNTDVPRPIASLVFREVA